MIAQLKTCTVCAQAKSVDAFARRARSGAALRAMCQACASERRTAYAQQQPARMQAYEQTRRADPVRVARMRDREAARAPRRDTPEQQSAREARHLARSYGLSASDYACMLMQQAGMCAICASTPAPGVKLCVDHDHATGRVRALLCRACNLRVGVFEHKLARAITVYLAKHGGTK